MRSVSIKMARITSGCVLLQGKAIGKSLFQLRQCVHALSANKRPVRDRTTHRLSSNTMALITSDCGAMRLLEHEMALIASGLCATGLPRLEADAAAGAGADPRLCQRDLHDGDRGVELQAGGRHARVRDAGAGAGPPTTWTILQYDGPSHLGLWYNALREYQMALITSDCGTMRSVSIKWP